MRHDCKGGALEAAVTSAIACRQLRLLDGDGSGEYDGLSFPSEAARDSVAAARGTGLISPAGGLR